MPMGSCRRLRPTSGLSHTSCGKFLVSLFRGVLKNGTNPTADVRGSFEGRVWSTSFCLCSFCLDR